MNFFPGIYEGKRVKKPTAFSNPLTGGIYNNKEFLKNCRMVPRCISDLDHIKELKYEINRQQNFLRDSKFLNKKKSLTKQERKRMQREIIAIHATSRMAQPMNKSFGDSSVCIKNSKKQIEVENGQKTIRQSMSKTFRPNNNTTRQRPPEEFSKSFSMQSHTSIYFNDIEILILDLLKEKEDFRTKMIRINLHKYFRSFFKKQLLGHITHEFLNKVEFYIQELLQRKKMDEPIDQQQYPIQLFTINSRISFLNKLEEYESKRTPASQQNIGAMIKFYCIPSKEFRESCLRDILLILSLQLFEKFNCDHLEDYVLLDQNGHQIEEILQIRFTTKKLFLSLKKNAAKNFAHYHSLLDQFYKEGKKLTFTENIKLNFRKRLAQGKFDDSHYNYIQNYDIEKLKRCTQLQNAEQILKKRTQIHRFTKFTARQQTPLQLIPQYNSSKLIVVNQNKNQTIVNSNGQISQKQKIEESFWKMHDRHITPQLKNHAQGKRSPSPTRSKSPHRAVSSMNKQSQFSKEKLHKLLMENKKKYMNPQIEKSFRQQFRDYVTKNDIVNFQFNHHFKNRVLKDVLRKNFVYFQDKTDLQVNKIFQVIQAITLPGDAVVSDMEISSKLQMSMKPEIQAGKELNEEQKLNYIDNSFSWEQFRNLKSVVTCSGPKEVIMQFIARYLGFDEFGQLEKTGLRQQIEFILDEKCESSTIEVITEVIWSWFQANNILQNGFIRRTTLQSWYEKYKIVYFMLASLIFGTNHKTVLDLAYEVLC